VAITNQPPVVVALVLLGQEVEDRTVVPQRVAPTGVEVEHVGDVEGQVPTQVADPLTDRVERGA
jgi:hypothetical protein